MTLLRGGRPLVSCREACVNEWRRSQPQAAQLDASGRAADLAVLVRRVGYQDDLSLYYLGRAAEALGYRAAAAGYYRESAELSATAISCQRLSGVCGGVALPRSAVSRAALLERELTRRRPREGASAAPVPEPQAPAAEEFVAPSPSPFAVPLPAPVASPGGPAPSEYIEPPPAAR